jgi:hypothetical protein
MKLQSTRHNSGNTLAVVLILTSIMGFTLASYLILVRQQNVSIMRSVSWNACIPAAEAGIEEAMTHINRSGLGNLESSGWTLLNGVYTKTRTLGNSYFITAISATDPPTIVSEGYVLVPGSSAGSLGWLAATGLETCEEQYTKRRVRVTTRRQGAWLGAMVAKGTIDLSGNGIETDSYDSTDPNKSTGGRYDPGKRKDKGDIASNLTIENSIDVGNANIYGHAATGPEGTIGIGPNGRVGSLTWGSSGIEPGWSSDDMNIKFPNVVKPFTSGFTVQSGTLNGTTFTYLLNGGPSKADPDDFSMGSLTLTSKQVMLITNHVRLLVTGNISVKGTIKIARGSSLELYMEGASTDIGGNGIVNESGSALNFFYFGLPSHTSIKFAGNGEFIGAIYAPNADLVMSGGGNGDEDFMGASVSKTVTMNGHFHFHYDEALANAGLSRGYIVDSWNEI